MKTKNTIIAIAISLLFSGNAFAQVARNTYYDDGISKPQNGGVEYVDYIQEYQKETKAYNAALEKAINSPDFVLTDEGQKLAMQQLRNIQVGSGLKTGAAVTGLITNAVLLPTAFAVGKQNPSAQNGILIADGVVTGVCGIIAFIGLCKVSTGTKWFTIQGDKVVFYIKDKNTAYKKLKRSEYGY